MNFHFRNILGPISVISDLDKGLFSHPEKGFRVHAESQLATGSSRHNTKNKERQKVVAPKRLFQKKFQLLLLTFSLLVQKTVIPELNSTI